MYKFISFHITETVDKNYATTFDETTVADYIADENIRKVSDKTAPTYDELAAIVEDDSKDFKVTIGDNETEFDFYNDVMREYFMNNAYDTDPEEEVQDGSYEEKAEVFLDGEDDDDSDSDDSDDNDDNDDDE